MATEKRPWLNKYTAGLAVVVTTTLVGVALRYIGPAVTAPLITSLATLFSRPIALWYALVSFVVGFAVAFLLLLLFLRLDSNRLPNSHLTEVYGLLWGWSAFGDSLRVSSTPLCPVSGCANELTTTDEAYVPDLTFLSKYPDRYAAHVACDRLGCEFKRTFDGFQSIAELHTAVEKEIRRLIRNEKLTP